MRSIDVHAHLTPQCFWRAAENGGNWHTMTVPRPPEQYWTRSTMTLSAAGRLAGEPGVPTAPEPQGRAAESALYVPYALLCSSR